MKKVLAALTVLVGAAVVYKKNSKVKEVVDKTVKNVSKKLKEHPGMTLVKQEAEKAYAAGIDLVNAGIQKVKNGKTLMVL